VRLPTFKIVLPDDLRAALEERAEREGLSLGEAIRQRLVRSIEESDLDPRIRRLQSLVGEMVVLIEASTGCRFDRDVAARETLRRTISLWLEITGAMPDAKFEEGDMARGLKLVPGTDPANIATAIAMLVVTGTGSDMVRKIGGRDEPKIRVIDTLDWLEKRVAEAEEGQKHEAAEKSKRRRMRRSDSER
jgi:hypothetical protein